MVGKVLRKHNKQAPFQMTKKRLALLLCVNQMQHHELRRTHSTIHRKFNDIGHGDDWLNLLRGLQDLQRAKLLEKVGTEYSVTVEGRMLLDKLENMLRKERIDK